MMKKAVVITVRSDSSRLPNKAFMKIMGTPTIEMIIKRAKLAKGFDEVILCTSERNIDDELVNIAKRCGIRYFRGSLDDKLERWKGAVERFGIDLFVTMDGDDLLCDPYLLELGAKQIVERELDFIKAPEGLATGAFTYGIRTSALKKVCEIKDTADTEMMWVYFEDTGRFRVGKLKVDNPVFFNDRARLTLDYEEDFRFFTTIFETFNNINNDVPLEKIMLHLKDKPEVYDINWERQKDWMDNQKKKTKLVIKEKENMKAEHFRFCGNELKYLKEVLDSGFISGTTGAMNKRLEEAFSSRFGTEYAITVNSATSGLHAALAACGVCPGDEVIIPPLTVVMNGLAVLQMGAVPVFADINPDTFLIDPDDIEKKITSKTKAITVVHLYGLMPDMDKIMNIAKKHNIYVIEDCAQAFLTTDPKGRIAGSIGHFGVYSFENSKHLSTGDGGIAVTNDEILAERFRKFAGMGFKNIKAKFGQVRKNKDIFQDPVYLRHDTFGYNYRLTELGAAVGLAQLERIEHLVSLRQNMAAMFTDAIKRSGSSFLVPQKVPEGYVNSYYTYAARYEGDQKGGVSWYDFRKKFIEYGNDGIYSAWALIYNEPSIRLINDEGKFYQELGEQWGFAKGFLKGVNCPNSEKIQPMIMQFPTNQGTEEEVEKQSDALYRTLKHFG